MMGKLLVVLLVALTGVQVGQGLPLRSTPQVYPHDPSDTSLLESWGSGNGLYAAIPALALVLTAVGLLFGCTWCYRHKDCKPNEGADNQLFTASATHLHDARRPPDSGFSEPANNNISEDNNNGPISLREMQNIANNNAAAYITSENEERNRVSRESVVEFEPLPNAIRADPLEHCADWFGGEDLPRNRLQYLREIGRGWFGRVVEGEIENEGTTTVAVKILNQNASLEDKARFLDEARLYRDITHENILAFVAKCLQEDPWILMFELCSTDLHQFLEVNRPKMAILNESGVPLQLMCDVASALTYLHSRGYMYGHLSSSNVLVREATSPAPRAVLGCYAVAEAQTEFTAPETRRHPPVYTTSSEVWSMGTLIWEVCAWGAPVPPHLPPPPDLPCPYRNHLYQVMQLCWNPSAESRPTSTQVHALLNHLHVTHTHAHADTPADDGYGSSDFEERWQRLKPNTIPKVDEHVALVHAPSTSMASHFTGSDQEFDNVPTTQDTLSADMDTAVSRSSSIMSDKDPLSVQIKSESLTNLHGSLEDVRNIYLTHNETATLECHQGNISFEDRIEREQDRSDSSVVSWVKGLITGSQDDVSYYKDVSDVIKNLDNILNSEKTSSSESSHQASPSRDNLSLDCKKEYPVQSCLVKSPGITNFQNIIDMGFDDKQDDAYEDEEVDRYTIGTLSHSYERHSDTTSQHTLANLTPDTPIKDIDVVAEIKETIEVRQEPSQDTELPKENIDSSYKLPKLKDLCVVSLSSVSDTNEQLNVREDCETSCDSNLDELLRTQVKTKSIGNTEAKQKDSTSPVLAPEKNDHKFGVEISVERVQDEITEVEEDKSNKFEKDAGPEKNVENSIDTILPKINEIATNLIENEIIHPAITIVSKMVQENKAKEAEITNLQNDFELDVRENVLDSLTKNVDAFVKEENETPIEEKSKVAECLETSYTKPSKTHETILITEESPILEKTDLPHSPIELPSSLTSPTKPPEPVQIVNVKEPETSIEKSNKLLEDEETPTPVLLPDLVQNTNEESNNESDSPKVDLTRSEDLTTEQINQSYDSTVYMDLINYTSSEKDNDSKILQDDYVEEVVQSCFNQPEEVFSQEMSMIKNESTVYLDLPSILKDTHNFLQEERMTSQIDSPDKMCASTPKGSECSADSTLDKMCASTPKGSECSADSTLDKMCASTPKGSECSADSTLDSKETTEVCETKILEESTSKVEQKLIQELLSPFESPTKSHPTDTYDENSSVVLGPFENCSMEYKGIKTEVELPKEELLAFSSNFSEINLETPSPLRDGNFLMEVPDIVPDDLQFDDLTLSEVKKEEKTENTEETDQPGTAKHMSPSTPPNSPGIYLASTSQEKYLVNIDLEPHESQSYPPLDSDSGLCSLQKEIDLNQIELQITTKLAMAENENNMNIEYSGPLTVEGLVSEEDAILRESDAMPEAFLAGNGGAVEESDGFTLDEDCMAALRNELELKLPLAQVAGIEPAPEGEWGALPPPPELLVRYAAAGALSPIQEETGHQLTQYENDAWNTSTRTDSSESYPEPCNDSTAEVTELPTASQAAGSGHSTYTISNPPSGNNTYTVQKDIPSSKELTMSADSLNGSPFKKLPLQSPVDDRTYNKNDDDKFSNCERISQVSPFLMSPTTETSAPDSVDNATGVSTLSKTSVPTDAKHSKPSECLSKATSIDSWCSNDTLYNVEENFEDLVLDADIPPFENVREKSASTETLTRNDEDKEVSHCSTYIVHDSKSEAAETFSPDSITANDNYTYTKARTEATGTTPSIVTNEADSKNSQTKDLAYGTLPSYSNCTTELISGIDDPWKFAQPEMVRRSPIADEVTFTPPRLVEDKETVLNDSPQIKTDPIKKMDSLDATCLHDEVINSQKSDSSESQILVDMDSPQYRNNMAPSITSTPKTEQLLEEDEDNDQVVPMNLPQEKSSDSEILMNSLPNFQTFFQSAEIRPQDISTPEQGSTNQDTEILLEGESKTLSRNSNRDSMTVSNQTPTYSDFERSAALKPQEMLSKSNQSLESGMSSGDFRQFENSVRGCPQDLSSLINTNSLFLDSERKLSEATNSNTFEQTSQSSRIESAQTVDIRPPNTNLVESHTPLSFNMFVTDLDEEETDQPHSIIITDVPIKYMSTMKSEESPKEEKVEESPNRTYDSHTEEKNCNVTYNSHSSVSPVLQIVDNVEAEVNGVEEVKGNETFDSEMESTNGKVRKVKRNKNDVVEQTDEVKPTCNGNSQNYATVNFIHESFEELMESNVDDSKDTKSAVDNENAENQAIEIDSPKEISEEKQNGHVNGVEEKVVTVTKDFLQNEKKFCMLDSYLPLLSDIRFTGPATEIMSTSFTQDSPTEPNSPECEQDNKPDTVADIVKEWDSDSESHSSNSSSGEFIWKDGDGHETAVVPTTHFDHQQRGGGSQAYAPDKGAAEGGGPSEASGDSGSGSEGDEVEFVPSSWDCRAAPSKSSLRSLEQAPPTDSKKRVVFKRQKYHCVYEYPRELAEVETHSPAYLPDLSTYCEWDPTSAEEAELGYGQLYGTSMDMYPLRSGIAFGTDYDEDFFISSSARPFESFGIMSTSSQFFPGMHMKAQLLERDPVTPDQGDFPEPPSPLPPTTLTQTRTPSLDFTTPDSGVEDITPGSTSTDEDFKTKKLPENEVAPWRPVDSGSSSESVSPSSPGGEALGGLRHTRDKLKLDLPPSPHIPSPRHNRVFNFVLDKPKRHRIPDERPVEIGTTPLVMTDETPIITSTLPIQKDAEDVTAPEPTFSTFGKGHKNDPESEQKIILTDEAQESPSEEKEETPVKVEAVKGEGTVLDSGDEDSGIESSSKATLERKANVS